ncbi:MAG: HAD family phosphatase [Acidimicrobiia bacterium]|nr:HAD family phosphatase [Acidimicrobiia bacterium]
MDAVIFDCDGVIVDSEPIAWDAWAALIVRHTGGEPDAADGPALVGIDLRASAEYLVDRYRLPSVDKVIDEYQTELLDRYETELEAFDDVVRTVRELAAQGIPLGVASSSERAELDLKLGRFDLVRYFDAVVGGDEVAATKPAPDVYLRTAELMRVPPSACLVIEDSVVGAQSAQAAGMRVVVIARDGVGPSGYPSINDVDAALILEWLG